MLPLVNLVWNVLLRCSEPDKLGEPCFKAALMWGMCYKYCTSVDDIQSLPQKCLQGCVNKKENHANIYKGILESEHKADPMSNLRQPNAWKTTLVCCNTA